MQILQFTRILQQPATVLNYLTLINLMRTLNPDETYQFSLRNKEGGKTHWTWVVGGAVSTETQRKEIEGQKRKYCF